MRRRVGIPGGSSGFILYGRMRVLLLEDEATRFIFDAQWGPVQLEQEDTCRDETDEADDDED